jgi:hypothetical protein
MLRRRVCVDRLSCGCVSQLKSENTRAGHEQFIFFNSIVVSTVTM